jgi:urease accessory protein
MGTRLTFTRTITITSMIRMSTEKPSLSTPALLRLMQLVSPALPIGGYNFSQGLEYAIHSGWVHDEASSLIWIRGLACSAIGTLDIPVLCRLHGAWSDNQPGNVDRWSRFLIASRETSELRAEDRHLGRSLAKVLAGAGIIDAQPWTTRPDATFATLFTLACCRWNINANDAACGYLWAWAENQALAAVKTVPLGQSAGQRILHALIQETPSIVESARDMTDEDIGSCAPLHLIASASHETQYTRLFRS